MAPAFIIGQSNDAMAKALDDSMSGAHNPLQQIVITKTGTTPVNGSFSKGRNAKTSSIRDNKRKGSANGRYHNSYKRDLNSNGQPMTKHIEQVLLDNNRDKCQDIIKTSNAIHSMLEKAGIGKVEMSEALFTDALFRYCKWTT